MKEFKQCVLESYRPLLEEHEFQELPKRKGESVNPYSVRIGNRTTVIEVEGIHYGSAAWTKLFRTSDADSDYYGLPIRRLLDERAPITNKKRSKQISQLDQIREDAARILANAADIIAGDFSAIDALVERQNKIEEERRARAPSPEEKAANIAASEAGHAFKAGDFRKVVDLLSSHLSQLSKGQQKKLQIALSRMDNG